MTQLSEHKQLKRGRIFPEHTISQEQLVKRQAQRQELGERCRVIFEQIRPELIEQYANWFIAIEPISGNYLISQKLEDLLQEVQIQYGRTRLRLTIFRINETGACGQI